MDMVWQPAEDEVMRAAGWQWSGTRPLKDAAFLSPDGGTYGYQTYTTRRRALLNEKASGTPVVEVVDLPSPAQDKAAPEVKKLGLATADDLAQMAYVGVMILTAVLAFGTKQTAFAMRQDEAWALAVPLGNILQKSALNKRYGHVLRDATDYTAIGWVLYAYLSRVGQEIRAQVPEALKAPGIRQANVPTAMTAMPVAPVSPVPPAVPATPAPSNGRSEAPPDFARSQPFTPRPALP